MVFTERTINQLSLFFAERNEYVIIGVNKINKIVYYQHKKTFDKIIKFGDTAWNKPLENEIIEQFVYRLDEYKRKLENCSEIIVNKTQSKALLRNHG